MNQNYQSKTMKHQLNTPIGDRWLSAWQPVPTVVWVQTRNPKLALKLSKRSDSRLVARGVSGGYLRTFEFTNKSIAWAKRLLTRYTTAANEP